MVSSQTTLLLVKNDLLGYFGPLGFFFVRGGIGLSQVDLLIRGLVYKLLVICINAHLWSVQFLNKFTNKNIFKMN